jgi:hypothetical protein
MASNGERKGCFGGIKNGDRPKTAHSSRDSAQRQLEWMVTNLGSYREQLRVYECRYAPADEPHFHVGHKPGSKRGAARRGR